MDGRRHSVDIPISRTLVALRRVRSLRDPSTLSTSKFSALLDNANWDTDSNTGISLRFLESRRADGGGSGENRGSRPRNAGLHDSIEDRIDEFELGRCKSYEEEILKRKSLSERFFGNRVEKTGVIPSINPLEDVESSNEPSVGSLQERMDRIALQRNFGSDCPSPRDALSSRSLSVLANEDDDDDGFGMRCCWSGTPTFRETNSSLDIENNPLLGRDVDENVGCSKRCLKHGCNEIIPHSETARSLSQKFRPKSFGELVGQNVVARSLLGAVCRGRVTSLYLFHGPRGTGKTSASRVFAAALNCLSLDERRPCGVCRECAVFFSGRSRDVREVDSVWVNRRGRVRSLMKKATSPPVSSRFKVFIVDECHLLHGETWATLLHSLDSLLQHVVFVMITPELDKLPRSALSRSQRYHFPKIKDSDIAGRLAKICVKESLDFDEVALDFIASKSSGSMRDAEMMLDQLSLLGKKITVTLTYELIGVVSDDELLDLLDLAMSSDSSKTVIRARELMRSRIDPMQLISQLANLIMDILAGCQEGCSEVRRNFSSRHSSEVDLQKLSHALKILSETEKQLRVSKNQTTWLTVALLQLSSLECSSTEVNDSRFWINNAHDRGEGLKHLVDSSSEEQKSDKLEMPEDHKRTLESLWKRTIELCQSTSLRHFLMEQGKLSSLLVGQGVAIAELEFSHPDFVCKAEKSLKLIADSLQSILGCNVDIRINLVPYTSGSMYARVKNASLRLFGWSRRILKSQSSPERETDSDYTEYTSERPMMSDRSVIPYSCDCGERSDVVRPLGNNGERIASSSRTASSDLTVENNTPTTVLASASSNGFGFNNGADVLAFNQPKNRAKCFPRKFRANKKSRSSVSSQTVRCTEPEEERNKLALAIMRRTSFETSVGTENSNIFYNSSNNRTNPSVDENGLREDLEEAHCWRTPTLHLRKAWRSRHQRENSCLVGWALPCGGAK